jgi:hypothetical protein
MVLGILALLLSWVPIINNLAAILALVGLGLGIPALIRARRGTQGGTGLAITGLVTSVLALVLVVLTQLLFVSAIDEVERSLDESIGESETAPADPGEDEDVASTPEIVPLGVPAQVGDYEVTVDAVELNGNATVAGANEFNDPPTGQYVITQLTVTYLGTEEGTPAWDLTAIFHGTDSASTATPTARRSSRTTPSTPPPSTAAGRTPSSSAWTCRREPSRAASCRSSRP